MQVFTRLVAFVVLAVPSWAELKVVTTIPDLKDIAKEIGKEHVSAKSIARGMENIHSVVLRPSHLVAVRKADVFIQIGLSLEHSFVPGLLQRARNRKIAAGQPGYINCSDGWDPIQVGMFSDRSQTSDAHPQGNPHINLDPRAGKHFADVILAGLIAVDPNHEDDFRANHKAYCKRLEEAEIRWKKLGEKIKGLKVCTYHRDFDYLARAIGMEIVDTVEPTPGTPPKPRDLAQTIEVLRKEKVDVILTAGWSNNKNVRFIAEKAGATILELPIMVQDQDALTSWIEMMDFMHESLAKVAQKTEDGKEA